MALKTASNLPRETMQKETTFKKMWWNVKVKKEYLKIKLITPALNTPEPHYSTALKCIENFIRSLQFGCVVNPSLQSLSCWKKGISMVMTRAPSHQHLNSETAFEFQIQHPNSPCMIDMELIGKIRGQVHSLSTRCPYEHWNRSCLLWSFLPLVMAFGKSLPNVIPAEVMGDHGDMARELIHFKFHKMKKKPSTSKQQGVLLS